MLRKIHTALPKKQILLTLFIESQYHEICIADCCSFLKLSVLHLKLTDCSSHSITSRVLSIWLAGLDFGEIIPWVFLNKKAIK